MPLGIRDQQYLAAAEGYIELGLFDEAVKELEEIDPYGKVMPEVSRVRLRLFEKMGKWELMETVAAHLANEFPEEADWSIALAFATRRKSSIGEAEKILEEALQRHPRQPIIHYNLACYDCQQRDLESAKSHLARAFQLDLQCRSMALDDKDLEPLWDTLACDSPNT